LAVSGLAGPVGRLYRTLMRAVRLPPIRRAARHDAPAGQGTVTIAGIFRSPTGVGEGARVMALALGDLGYTVGLRDISRSRPSDVLPVVAGANIAPRDVGGPLVVHANPPTLQHELARIRPAPLARRLCAYWAWELPVVPRAWRDAASYVHEIWVPTRFVADAVATAVTGKTIRVVPHPLRLREGPGRPRELAPGRCVYLTMFSDGSGFERKNPVATVTAFRRAFGDRQDVLLVVKAQALGARKPAIERRLREAIAGASNITVIDDMLSTEDRDALVARADVMVSLHRSEGFGLTLAEAMLVGKPVVATGWSGNVDFMSPDTGALVDYRLVPVLDPGGPYDGMATEWAEPDIDCAAAALVRLADPEQRRRMGAAARRASAAFFRPERFAEIVAPTLGLPAPRVAVGATPQAHDAAE
jgi:glycosyltransferase involved in cell wall biosynthesis